MKKRYFAAVLIITILIGTIICISITVQSCPKVRSAVKRSSLPQDGSYIICQWTQTGGYSWIISSSNRLGEKDTYCLIKGPTPLDLDLKYDFIMSRNTYVFYVTDVHECYSDELNEHVLEYTVSDWDILYPVRRESMVTIYKTPGDILESDLNRK